MSSRPSDYSDVPVPHPTRRISLGLKGGGEMHVSLPGEPNDPVDERTLEALRSIGQAALDRMKASDDEGVAPIDTAPLLGRAATADSTRVYEDCSEWEKALRAIVLAGEMGCPPEALALAARKALVDCGVPFEEQLL